MSIKKIKKIFLVIERMIIRKLIYFNNNLYMKKYSIYLKKIGINIQGTPRFINNDVYFDGNDYSKITLGDNITISREVMLLTHDYSLTTGTYSLPDTIKTEMDEIEYYTSKPIVIGKDCFIGARASILPGTVIGDNVIVGACSVVKGNIPNNSIIVGNPARVIGVTDKWTKNMLERNTFLKEYK